MKAEREELIRLAHELGGSRMVMTSWECARGLEGGEARYQRHKGEYEAALAAFLAALDRLEQKAREGR